MTIDESTRFDQALRGHHHVSLQQFSPQVRAQLAQRRHAALRGTSPHRSDRRHGLGYAAAGFAAVCALAIGVQFRSPPTPAPAANTMLASMNASASRADSVMLEQDPDFYAWLASADAMQVAME
ncbi:hypothetical protein [Thermomonas sp.]